MTQFGYGGQRGGGGIRILIGLGIVVFGIIGYFAKTQVNPVTGEKQHIGISVDQEKALGLQAAPEMAGQMGGDANPSDPAAAKVQEIGRKLIASSEAGRSPYADNFHFHLLNDAKTVNAFALPGGQVFITRALYDKLQNEAQLAGVLGHEVGHVIARHSAEQMAKGELGQKITTGVYIGASDDRGRGQIAAAATAMANQMLQLRYSRKDELQADWFGLKYSADAGFDPSQMLEVMRILKAVSGTSGGSAIFQTHPDPDARIDAINAYLKEKYSAGIPGSLSKGAALH